MRYALQILPLEITETKHSSLHVQAAAASRTSVPERRAVLRLSLSVVCSSNAHGHHHRACAHTQCRRPVFRDKKRTVGDSLGMPVRLGARKKKKDSSRRVTPHRSKACECRVISPHSIFSPAQPACEESVTSLPDGDRSTSPLQDKTASEMAKRIAPRKGLLGTSARMDS